MGSECDLGGFEQVVLETLKRCQQQNESTLVWVMEVAKCIRSLGVGLPCLELGHVLVSQLCFDDNNSSLWKFVELALSSGLLYPLHVLSLLTSRVLPHRRSQPKAYRLYLELLSRYAFSFNPEKADACKEKMTKSIDVALQLSQLYGLRVLELGQAFVLFFFSMIIGLIDSTLDDWGLRMTPTDGPSLALGSTDHHDMDIDFKGSRNFKGNEHHEKMRTANSFMAIEVLGKLTESRKAIVILRLVHLNMPVNFNGLLQRLQFLEASELVSPHLNSANQLLAKLSANIQRAMGFQYQLNRSQLIGLLLDIASCKPVSCFHSQFGQSACWAPFDIYMENAMDGKQLPIKSAVDVLTETIKTLQAFNQASWQETFLALWLSALRLVQREHDPLEGPIPRLEARLCVLLSIVPLAIANVLEDEAKLCHSSTAGATFTGSVESGYGHKMNGKGCASRKDGLISSLQILGHFSGLLCPPVSVTDAANTAARKAASFITNAKNQRDIIRGGSLVDASVKAGGDMRHLIVEACIARNLIDTSAYIWPGYVSASIISLSDSLSLDKSPWLMFMEGAPLNGSLIDYLIMNPASSLAEIEKLFSIALNGSEEEKSAAAKILCGASLSRGWNIQVPEVAASLMPLCEVFGSLKPASSNKSSKDDEPSIYMVFSFAFLYLLRLWKFYRPPLEQCISERGAAVRGELTLEYLLLLRNRSIASCQVETYSNPNQSEPASGKPIYIDSYPKLRAWYCQNKSCIASTLAGLSSGNPVHQVANKILSMIYWKMTKSAASSSNSSTPTSNSACGSPGSTGEDAYQRPVLPAWEVLEAIPFVLEAILTACAHGRLSPRDLTTGLRDLVDFLPASLAAIVSYFSAEVTRGIWKPVAMNGKDWPSPAAILPSMESEIKAILAAVGVDAPSCYTGNSPIMLPLPMAALVSLTITFKLDKSLEYVHSVAGLALEHCASGCPWPSMHIIGSLWAQKIRRWHNFIVVSSSRSIFRQNKEAVAQLLRSCFTSFLGSLNISTSSLSNQSSVNGLLGSTISVGGGGPSVAPGFLFLRSCRTIHNVHYVSDVIVGLIAEYARNLASRWASSDSPRLKSSQTSLSIASVRAREVATLGASLLCVTGGVQLVQELFRNTIPTWLISSRKQELHVSAVPRIVEGYAMAYLLILSGAIIWGVEAKLTTCAFSRRARAVGVHMDFLAGVLEGNISLGCDPATWKAYLSCLVGLMVRFAPAWIQEVKLETLRKLACGLRGWHECELAVSLLERGGTAAVGSVAELLNVIS
ncbi:mediator of RNA polymerase II transcription subunit 33A-like isoform X2 [Carya illinoinensis]|uniref:Mediator of RNA polymerase II transcription subunit 33A n=1 Tax=Carya illinoinensis TaxID=32201 RepID=A0A8T1PGG9_CARIL|nr:mediator of RNA polymerase II transcription subunit 33A-like isoform X2 [Carya illinoinensis]KAG6643626.1 hypothetical protein CIPAW_09G224900 [Carya illinoinensis]